VVIQRHHKIPPLLFSCSISFSFSLIIIQKQQKHANNQNHKKHFFTINLDPQIERFLFLLFLNQISINLITFLSHLSFNIKKYKQILFPTWLFHLKLFSKLIKNTKHINQNFYPKLRGSDPSRVRKQMT